MPRPRLAPRRRSASLHTGARALAAGVLIALAAPRGGAQVVRGAVYDSLAGAPLAGATVQLVRADAVTNARSTTADSAGAFRFDSLAPGDYLVAFVHPLLDVLEIEVAPRKVTVTAGPAAEVSLAVPGWATMRAALCGADSGAAQDSTGLLVGMVRNADTEGPVPGARVVLTWKELVIDRARVRTEQRRIPVPVRADGSYIACNVPADAPVAASAEAPGRATGLVEVALGPRRFLRRDLVVGDSGGTGTAPAGQAQLAGIVRDSIGRPLPGARVQVWGSAPEAVTGADGRFTLTRLPTGTRTAEVRAVGYAPRRVTVDLVRGRPASLQLTLAKAAPVIDRVTVYGKVEPAAPWEKDFDRRRRQGFGRFFTTADVAMTRPVYVTDVVRRAPGVHLEPRRFGPGYAVLMVTPGGFCAPAIVVDGSPFEEGDELDSFVRPEQVAAVEVYRGPVGTPLDYGGLKNTGCGEVLIWTKR